MIYIFIDACMFLFYHFILKLYYVKQKPCSKIHVITNFTKFSHDYKIIINHLCKPVADPGFPIGGGADLLGGTGPLGGHQPPTCTLFGKNISENERN